MAVKVIPHAEWPSAFESEMKVKMRRLLLALSLLSQCVWASSRLAPPSSTFRIDAKTHLQDVFKCSGIHSIGSFNEYYVACELRVPHQESLTLLEVVNVSLDGAKLSPLQGVHAELNFQLNTTIATVSLLNAQLQASGVEFRAANVSMDEHSSVDVSGRGLKFGPGYNSWSNMGGSYGGIGGASLNGIHHECDDVPPNDFFRAVGDVSADSANFRGYGSGGGNEQSRGGGRIRLVAGGNVEINGSLLANGGDSCTDCYDSAGSGGSILVTATERIHGNATVQVNGGQPSAYKSAILTGGGGGGGGGGRIVFDSKNAEELGPSRVEAYGGGYSSDENSAIAWCQLGGDGTIFKLQHSTKDDGGLDGSDEDDRSDDSKTLVGTLLVKGDRLSHAGPVKRIQIYGCTPIFEQTSRGAPFLPQSLAHIFVGGGATLCASVIQLKETVGGIESSIVLDSGSELNVLDRDRIIRLSASQLTLQGYVGPSSQQERDLFDVALVGADVSFSNALAMVHELDVTARGAFSIDKYSELKFRERVEIQTGASAKIEGFLQPLSKSFDMLRDDPDDIPVVSLVSKKDIELRPQTVEMGPVALHINASGMGFVDMPFDTPFLRLSMSATNVSIANVNSGPVLECKEIELQADASACSKLRSSASEKDTYSVSVFASQLATFGNISAGSMILCSENNMTIEGTISSSSLGCGTGIGPGKSEVAGEASGGAGHGGRGGNVLPGSTGAGAVYDTSTELMMQHSAIWFEATSSSKKNWPIWPGSGAASGDTPNKIIGGGGGGIIYIGSTKLVVSKVASVSARGGDGSMGGGGGSGGAMTLFVADISGGGIIDLAGGAAATPAFFSIDGSINRSSVWDSEILPNQADDDAGKLGGGGGGGVIRITYQDSAEGVSGGNGEQFIKDGGRVSVDGGESKGGENGGTGVMVGANCQPGRGGVFCLPCPEGSHSSGRFSKCTPCDPGSYSSHTGAAICDVCATGHFNPDFGKKECQECPSGSFGAKVGLKKCALCPPGTFAGLTGRSVCSSCPMGTITTSPGNSNCTVCGIGKTTAKVGSIVCVTCKIKPTHSEFNMHGNCSYACDKGRNGLDCLTPFERFVKPIGGPIGFVILVFSVTGLIFGSWGYIAYRSSKSELRRYAQYKAQRLRDELSLETLTRTLTPRLTDQDLSAHVARLYLSGDNHLKSAWRLNPYFLPTSLRDIVEEGTFAGFASTCNKLLEWDPAGWEAWMFRFLLVVMPPAGTLFMRRRQLHRVVRLSKYIVQYGGRFFRDMNFRVHGTQLKVGFSSDFSLGYFDVLISQSASSSTTNLVALQTVNRDDVVLVVAGSGSFFRPYHLDTNDIIVRAIPSRLELLEHNFWIDFVAEINQKLRVLPQPSSAVRRVREAAEVAYNIFTSVNAFNEKHVKNGFAVTFGTFSVGEAIAADGNESCFEPFSLDSVDERFESYPHESFKLAFRVSRLRSPKASPGAIDENLVDIEGPGAPLELSSALNDKIKAESDPRSADFRYSQIRMEALFAQPEHKSTYYGDDSSDESDSLTPLKKPHNSSSRRVRALMEFLCINDSGKRWLVAIWQPVYPLFRLRNLPRSEFTIRWFLSVTMVLLLIADMGVAFWIVVEYYCVQVRDPTALDAGCSRTSLWLVLGILPAAIIGSPMLGLVFVTRKNIFCGKLFAVWNCSSIMNQIVAFMCGLAYLAYVHDDILLVAAGGVLVKYFEKEVALRCIAQYASERPFRGWRGLHTTRDWYDAAYTPLVHYEN